LKKWRVALVGAGLIGARRARLAHEHPDSEVVSVADTDFQKARALAAEVGARAIEDWTEAVSDPAVNIVVVATPTDSHAPISLLAFKNGKHVLCEKPLARNPAEAGRMVVVAARRGLKLMTGFNHRFHPAILKSHTLTDEGTLGKLLFARCIYGHGGREGYEKEWRVKPGVSGGGELIDQGIHALDLFRWFLGGFREVNGFVGTLFWPVRPVEDNAFALLRTRQGALAQLHASWTQWKNRFNFEVYGEKGYIKVEGLGGSYGPESLTLGTRDKPGAVPVEHTEEFTGPDLSWAREWQEFLDALGDDREPLGNGRDGYEA